MRLWMIVGEPALAVLERTGRLVADGRRVDRDFKPAYRWMARQMAQRIGAAPRNAAYPLWAWAHWLVGKHRPDMRFSGHGMPGAACFRLTLEMPKSDVLLSDFDLWHFVLNGSYIAASEVEDEAFDGELATAGAPLAGPYPEPFRRRVEQSWQRVFDLDRTGVDPAWHGSTDERAIQATLWQVQASQVRKIERFTAR